MDILLEELLNEIYRFTHQKIDVIYNGWYGGFGLSDEACKLYKKITKKDINQYRHICRHDYYLVKVFKKLKEKFNCSHCQAKIISIPKKYINYYEINEYDGKETIVINYNKYKLSKIKNILESTITDSKKIYYINKIMSSNVKKLNNLMYKIVI